ncbi:MAG: hypothetical protein J6P89_02925 [Oscillospiraceae bacterium]|nr:hypothetical protein [Oscillospiraceae bacterium]
MRLSVSQHPQESPTSFLHETLHKSVLLYRELELSKKLQSMSEDEQFALLASDGMLVKRPLLVGDDFVLPGFKEIEWEENYVLL